MATLPWLDFIFFFALKVDREGWFEGRVTFFCFSGWNWSSLSLLMLRFSRIYFMWSWRLSFYTRYVKSGLFCYFFCPWFRRFLFYIVTAVDGLWTSLFYIVTLPIECRTGFYLMLYNVFLSDSRAEDLILFEFELGWVEESFDLVSLDLDFLVNKA